MIHLEERLNWDLFICLSHTERQSPLFHVSAFLPQEKLSGFLPSIESSCGTGFIIYSPFSIRQAFLSSSSFILCRLSSAWAAGVLPGSRYWVYGERRGLHFHLHCSEAKVMHTTAEGSTTGWENVCEYEETALLETTEESFGLLSAREFSSRDFFSCSVWKCCFGQILGMDKEGIATHRCSPAGKQISRPLFEYTGIINLWQMTHKRYQEFPWN